MQRVDLLGRGDATDSQLGAGGAGFRGGDGGERDFRPFGRYVLCWRYRIGGRSYRAFIQLAKDQASTLVKVDMGDAPQLFSAEKIKKGIDRTAHGQTLASPAAVCNDHLAFQCRGGLIVAIRADSANGPTFPMSQPPQLPTVIQTARWYSGPRLWKALSKATRLAGEKTLVTALTLFYCLQDKDTPPKAKAVIVGALGYFILPIDLIPDFLPGIGYSDDMSVLVIALGTVTAYIKDEHKAKASERFDKLLGKRATPPPAEFS